MTWVLVRGLLREKAHWGGFAAQLGNALPHEKIITLDIPGSGERHDEQSPIKVATMVDDLRSQLKTRCPTKRYKLLGISMGGMIVADWIYAFPAEVSRAVIINSSIKGINPFLDRVKLSAVPILMKAAVGNIIEKERQILNLVSNYATKREENLASWLSIAAERPVSRGNALRQLFAAYRFQLPTVKPNVQTLVLSSQNDRLVSQRCSEAIARTWNAAFCSHPTGGHDLIMDQPEWVIYEIKRWLKETCD